MLRTRYILAGISLSVVLLAAACSAPAPSAPAEPPTAVQNLPQPTIEVAPTAAPAQPSSSGGAVAQAPVCQGASSCESLSADLIRLDCVKKVPYTNVLVPVGTTFEVMDKSGEFVCNDTGAKSQGKEVLTCRGKELWSYQLKLSNPSCGGASNLQTGTGQCQQGYGFDATNQCCAPVAGNGGTQIVTVDMGPCPLPNSTKP